MSSSRPYTSADVVIAAGHRLHYYEWAGEGPPIILLHGSSGYGLMFQWMADAMPGHHVIGLDQRAHGDSDRPDGTYSAHEYARDLSEFIDALGLGAAVVGGQSLGGRVAQVFGATYPEQTLGLVLIGGVHVTNFFQTRANMQTVLESTHAMYVSRTEFATLDDADEYARTTRPYDPADSRAHRLQHNLVRDGDGYRVKYDPVRVAQGLTFQSEDLRPFAARVNAPVLMCRSTRASEITADEAAELATLWPDCTVVDVQGDYLLHVTGPEALATAVSDFVTTRIRTTCPTTARRA